MMNKLFFVLFVWVFSHSFSIGQVIIKTVETAAPTDTIRKEEGKLEKSLLWEITGNGLERPSFLFGTIHLITKDKFVLTDETKASFDQCERITFEINMEDMNDFSTLFSLVNKVMMPGDTTLKDLLNDEEYSFVKSRLSELGLPALFMGILERVKPLFLTTFVSGDMDPNGLQNGEIVSYEMELMKIAQNMEKEMAGLETIDYQISIFDSIPLIAQANMLVESLRAEAAGTDQFNEMMELYLSQDIEGMLEMLENESGGMADYDEVLLNNRNRNWIPIMRGMMKEKPTFFAVGAGHLGGENGVIRLLRKAGYTLRPLHGVNSK